MGVILLFISVRFIHREMTREMIARRADQRIKIRKVMVCAVLGNELVTMENLEAFFFYFLADLAEGISNQEAEGKNQGRFHGHSRVSFLRENGKFFAKIWG